MPSTQDEWKQVATGFMEKWNYPFCIGAIDGKHIAIQQPQNSGSVYYNYKHFFSIVLLALVDAEYQFMYVDVGANGRCGDAGIFAECSLKEAMEKKLLSIPNEEVIPGTSKLCNYHIIGDDAFPLQKDLMKPFPYKSDERAKRIYNYRLSRARRVVENAFGIMSNRFRFLLSKAYLQPEDTQNAVLATTCLHNFLIRNQGSNYLTNCAVDNEDVNHQVILGTWRTDQQLTGLQPTRNRNSACSAKSQRDALKEYFSSALGAVPWQNEMID